MLIRAGADVNAVGNQDDENMLSQILWAYWMSGCNDGECDKREYCSYKDYQHCMYNQNPNAGKAMCEVIRFFLDHGFDTSKCNGRYGAQCLAAVVKSTFDRYMVEATKMLLDAGAQNLPVTSDEADKEETPWNQIVIENSYQDKCEHDHGIANVYEAMYRIFQAIEEGRPYRGIDTYEAAIGKKICGVFTEANKNQPVFHSMNQPGFNKENCFTQAIYFTYEGGVLVCTKYAELWTDAVLPIKEMMDVSENFIGIVGSVIKQIVFEHKEVVKEHTHYGQAVAVVEMESGTGMKISTNVGEVEAIENHAAYCEMTGTKRRDDTMEHA